MHEHIFRFLINKVVSLNGQTVNLSFGSIRLESGISEVEIRINSF